MIDWNKRKEEIESVFCAMCDNKDICSDCEWRGNRYCLQFNEIIAQEQSMIKQLEADKAELLEALGEDKKTICKMCETLHPIEARCLICGWDKKRKELIQKMEESKCPTCNGEGSHYDDETGIEACPDCRGKGVKQ